MDQYVDLPETGGGGGGGANQSLSNLTEPTAVNVDLIFNGGGDAHVKTADVDEDDSSAITVSSGDSIDGNTGLAQFSTGSVTGTGQSGRVFLQSGATEVGASGRIQIGSGGGGSASGNITINTGSAAATDGHSGILNLNTGGTSDGAGNTGGINITTGDPIDGNSGSIAITTGTPSGAGSRGVISMNTLALRLPLGDTDPAGVDEGSIYYNSTSHVIRWYNGTDWADL